MVVDFASVGWDGNFDEMGDSFREGANAEASLPTELTPGPRTFDQGFFLAPANQRGDVT